MTEPAPVDLIHLRDADGTTCVVRVTGRSQPGVLTDHDILHADVLVSASHVEATLDVYLLQEDLDDWQRDLSDLAPGGQASSGQASIGGDRGLSLTLHMDEAGGGRLRVEIEDPDRLTTSLEIHPEGDWADEHRERLERVRKTRPSEVVETSPMTYEWSRNRKR